MFGSIVAFGAYLTLLKKVGAGPSAFVGVATPVVALALSTLFEGLSLDRRRRGGRRARGDRQPARVAVRRGARRADARGASAIRTASPRRLISFFQPLRSVSIIAPSRSGGPGSELDAFALQPRPDVGLREQLLHFGVQLRATTSGGVPAGATMPQ